MNHKPQTILPNFLIVGAARSGTTSLYEYLRMHPQVFMSGFKEPRFMISRVIAEHLKGIGDEKKRIFTDFDEYCRLFEGAVGKEAIGEASTEYLYHHQEAIKNIKHFLGTVKIIIMLRNPVDRAFSNYMHLVRDNREFLPFEQALAEEEKRNNEGWSSAWFYKGKGVYYPGVKAHMDNFRDVKICLYDDLKKDSVSLTRSVYDFLEVDASFEPDTRTIYNASGAPKLKTINKFFIEPTLLRGALRTVGKLILKEEGWIRLRDTMRPKVLAKMEMKPETRRYLAGLFREDILKLQDLIQRDLSPWLNSY
jgi:hypothetical protein